MQQEQLLKKREKKENIFNRILLFMIWLSLRVIFGMSGIPFIVMSAAMFLMALMKVDYALGTIITLWFLVPSDFFNFMFIASPMGNFPIYIILIVLFIAVEVLRNMGNIGIKIIISRTELDVFTCFFVIVLCLIMAYGRLGAKEIIPASVKFLFQSIAIFFLIKIKKPNSVTIDRLFVYILVIAAFVSVIAIFETISGFNIYEIYGIQGYAEWYQYAMSDNQSWRAKATFGNSLVFSSSLVMCLPIIEHFRRKGKSTWFAIIGLGILAVGIILSASRSAVLILGFYIVYYFVKSDTKHKILFSILCPIALFVVLSYVDYSLLVSRSSNITSQGSFFHRMNAYGVFLYLFLDHLIFGVGLGNTYIILQQMITNSFVTNTFDNMFLDTGMALGLVGMTSLILSVWKIYKHNLKRKYHNAMGLAILVFVLVSFFLNTAKYQSLWGMLWLYLSIYFFAGSPDENRNQYNIEAFNKEKQNGTKS